MAASIIFNVAVSDGGAISEDRNLLIAIVVLQDTSDRLDGVKIFIISEIFLVMKRPRLVRIAI